MRVLITGGYGFIGSALANHLKKQGYTVDILDLGTYAADESRVDFDHIHYRNDIRKPIDIDEQYDYILHLAAETHVDNSIKDPLLFVETNVLGTANVLEFARKQDHLKLFLYFSTDEVFGPAPKGTNYKEWDRYNSGNPYSAAKAGGEELVQAWGNTYNLPVITTHTMNAYGPGQHPEKFVPMTIQNVKDGNEVIIHSDSTKTISGSRFYIHTQDIAEAVEFVMNNGMVKDKYNIVGKYETTNLEVAEMISDLVDKPLNYKMVDFHSSRPGHDLRYALDGTKLAELGWTPKIGIKEGIKGLL